MFRFVTLSTSPSAQQSRMKSVRSDMKTNVKQNMRWIQNDSILTRGTGLLPVAFFRTNVKQSTTLYAEMFRYFVKIFCKLKLTVSVCRTRSAKRSRRPNVIRNWLWNIYFLVVFLLIFSSFPGVRGQVLGDLWDRVRGGLHHPAGAEVRGMDHLEIETQITTNWKWNET